MSMSRRVFVARGLSVASAACMLPGFLHRTSFALEAEGSRGLSKDLPILVVPIVATFSAIAIAVLMFYDIDRSTHLRNIERLERADEPDSNASATMNVDDAENRPASVRVS